MIHTNDIVAESFFIKFFSAQNMFNLLRFIFDWFNEQRTTYIYFRDVWFATHRTQINEHLNAMRKTRRLRIIQYTQMDDGKYYMENYSVIETSFWAKFSAYQDKRHIRFLDIGIFWKIRISKCTQINLLSLNQVCNWQFKNEVERSLCWELLNLVHRQFCNQN